MESTTGKIVATRKDKVGTTLSQDHASGETTLTVTDPFEFDEDGGTLDVDGTTYTYTGWDDDASTITLTTGLAADAEAGADVLLLPLEKNMVAIVVEDETGQQIDADVRHGDALNLPEGQLVPPVTATLLFDGDRWLVDDIVGRTPTPDAGLLVGELPQDVLSDGIPPTEAPTDLAVRQAAVGAVEASWKPPTPANPDPIVGYDVEASLASPWEGTPEVFRAGGTRATVSSINGVLLETNKAVQIRVRAVDADGPGPWTDVASAQPRIVDYDLVGQQIRDDIDAAAEAAGQAVLAANGKNKNTRSTTSTPSIEGRVEGDRHFTVGASGTPEAGEVVKIETLVNGVWVDEPVNVAVFAGVDAAWINAILLTADTILSRIIAAEQVTSEMIETDFIGARYGEILELIVGQLRTETNEIGDSMILDGATSSFTIWKDETRNEVLFRVGPQGAVNRIPMDTDGISAMGAVVLKSPDSRLDPGAAMTVSAGSVPDPSQPPLLSAGVKPVATWPTVPSGFRMRGISWDAVDGCWIRLLVSTASNVTGLCKVERISTSGASLGSVTLANILGTLEVDMNSIVRVGSSYFVNSFDSRSGQGWGVAKFAASTGAFQALSGTREGISGRPTLGVDVGGGGINVFEVFQGKLRIIGYAVSDLSSFGFGDALTSWSESPSLMGMVAAPSGLFSFSVAGSEQYAIITANKVVAVSRNASTGAFTRQSAHDITLDADIVQGGSGFRPGYGWHSTTAAIRTLGRYSTYRNPGGERAWATYADRNAAGNSTKDSPAASLLIPNHRWVVIDLPNPASAATEQWAYMGLGASLPLPSGFKHRTEPQEGRRIYADPTVPGGAAVPTANTFPGGSPASFKSDTVAGWELYGDGRSRFRTPVLADEAATKSYVDGRFSDSGWLPVTFASGYSAENETLFGTPAVRILNGAVTFRGAVRRTTGSFAASAVTQICSIPSSARPAFRNDFQTSGNTTASTTKIYCTAAGDISIVTGPTVPSYVNLTALFWPVG